MAARFNLFWKTTLFPYFCRKINCDGKLEYHIEANPNILYGKPVIKGTRVTVELVLEKMSKGQNFQDIIHNYPDLKNDDLFACLAYAASILRNEVTIPLAS